MPSVERVRWAKVRVLATSLVGLLILSVLVVLLTGGSFLQQKVKIYAYFPDGTGLAQGSPVRVDGIEVGKVEDVGLSGSTQPNRVVKITMQVRRNLLASITVDSTAQPAADTLVGDKFIQISSGSSALRIQPGAEIPYKSAADLTTTVDLSQFRRNLEQMDAILTDIETARSPLGEFIMTEDMYSDLLQRVGQLEHGIQTAVNTTSSVGQALYTDALYRKVADPIARMDATLARLQSGQGTAGHFLVDNAQYDQLRAQIASVRQQVADTGRMEYLSSPAAYDQWNRNLVDWIRKVDEFNVSPMLTRTDVYDNVVGFAKELQGSVADFRSDPRKFLRLKIF
jgi:phospholipid/cholesterol/gamma-HCH transport system substrate-binding protein